MYNYFVHVITCTKSQLVHDIYIYKLELTYANVAPVVCKCPMVGLYHTTVKEATEQRVPLS